MGRIGQRVPGDVLDLVAADLAARLQVFPPQEASLLYAALARGRGELGEGGRAAVSPEGLATAARYFEVRCVRCIMHAHVSRGDFLVCCARVSASAWCAAQSAGQWEGGAGGGRQGGVP